MTEMTRRDAWFWVTGLGSLALGSTITALVALGWIDGWPATFAWVPLAFFYRGQIGEWAELARAWRRHAEAADSAGMIRGIREALDAKKNWRQVAPIDVDSEEVRL